MVSQLVINKSIHKVTHKKQNIVISIHNRLSKHLKVIDGTSSIKIKLLTYSLNAL